MHIGGLAVNNFVKAVAIIVLFSLSGCVPVKQGPSKDNLRKAADANTQLGATYLYDGMLGAANEKLQKALRQTPKSVQANSVYALLLNELGKTDEAAKYFKKSLKFKTKYQVYR